MHRIPRRSSLAFGWRVEPQARASGLEQRAKLGIKRLSTMTMSPDFHAGEEELLDLGPRRAWALIGPSKTSGAVIPMLWT